MCSNLYDKTLNARKTVVTSDYMSDAVLPFLDEAKELLDILGSVGIAFDLVRILGDNSHGDLDSSKASGYGERPSDPIVDALLEKLAPKRRGRAELELRSCP